MNIINSYESKSLNNFNLHNKNLFLNDKKKRTKVFLIEFNGWQAIHIIFSYLVNYFKNERNCKIIAYECYDLLNRVDPPWYKKYFWKIGSKLYLKTFKIFKFLGTDKFIKPIYNEKINLDAEKIAYYFLKNKPSLKKLENFRIKNIWVGDLIYDSYLKKYALASIDLNSIHFVTFFKNSIKLYLFWYNFLKKNNVEGICACHSVYLTGIPLRVANNFNISCYSITSMNLGLVNISRAISYSKKINGTDIQFKYFKKIYRNFSKKSKKKCLVQGKKILKDFASGKKKYFYLKKKGSSKIKIKFQKINKSKPKVVIFAHDLIDSPHVYGNHFFTDFKEWFKFLDKIIKKTDYDWYIKEHPSSSQQTKDEINKLIENNKNLKSLNKKFPNSLLNKIGVRFVLTVYGSVASELPIYNINVINASRNNPHFKYNFCVNPKNISEYKKILLNLKNFKKKIKLNDLYIYHYMKYSVFKNNLFLKNQKNILRLLMVDHFNTLTKYMKNG